MKPRGHIDVTVIALISRVRKLNVSFEN